MKIQVLGTGCSRCIQLTANVSTAVASLGLAADIEKVEDVRDIMKFKVMSTPALAVDGVVKLAGRVPSVDELKMVLTH